MALTTRTGCHDKPARRDVLTRCPASRDTSWIFLDLTSTYGPLLACVVSTAAPAAAAAAVPAHNDPCTGLTCHSLLELSLSDNVMLPHKEKEPSSWICNKS